MFIAKKARNLIAKNDGLFRANNASNEKPAEKAAQAKQNANFKIKNNKVENQE